MKVRAGLVAIGLLAGCAAAAGAATDAAGAPANRLRAFEGCPSFRAYVQRHALPLVGAWGIAGPAFGVPVGALPPSAARDAVAGRRSSDDVFSGTNVQEQGVDEPDVVKTDGQHLYVLSSGRLSAVDVRGPRPQLVGTLRLELGSAQEMLLYGTRLLALSQAVAKPFPGEVRTGIRAPWPFPARSVLTEVDVSRPAQMRVVRTLELDGGYLTARLVGRSARIVLSSPLGLDLPFVQPDGSGGDSGARAAARNAEIVRSAGARSWIPGYTVRGSAGRVTDSGRLVQCRSIRRPPSFAGLGLVTVLTVDLGRGLEPVDSDAVVSDGRIVYASRSSLYVATDRFDRRLVEGRPIPETSTSIHRFDIASPTQTHYRSSGNVPGVLLSQWSLSEHGGILRVATTDRPLWWGGPGVESETMVSTLAERSGTLVSLGRVGGLGKGERVYAVRFAGDVGYVVTFRQVDPLYTLDLSVPSRPIVLGELKIRGYSAYLHPVGDGLVLGIGQDATDEGRVLGVQASLFDVSDLRRPRRLDAFSLGQSGSAAEHDHHAFLWWPRTRLAVVPVSTYDDRPFAGAIGLRVGRAAISEAGRVSHPAPVAPRGDGASHSPILRSLVVGDALYTVSDAGVKASSLASFVDLGFVRLRG
jgi:uncharacterized secreted protein with C-terminal beta-propeller domain